MDFEAEEFTDFGWDSDLSFAGNFGNEFFHTRFSHATYLLGDILTYMGARYSYLSHLECSVCLRHYNADELQTISPCCSRPLLARYDLEEVARVVTRNDIARREATMWRYHELLPVREERHVLTLGEGMTPLLKASRLAPEGINAEVRLLVKDEGQNPTGSF